MFNANVGRRGKKKKQQQKATRRQLVIKQLIVIQTPSRSAMSMLVKIGAFAGIFAAFAGVMQLLAGDNLIGRFTQKAPTELTQVRDPQSILHRKSDSLHIEITSPTNNATFTSGSLVILSARATSRDGTITKVAFHANKQLIGIAS